MKPHPARKKQHSSVVGVQKSLKSIRNGAFNLYIEYFQCNYEIYSESILRYLRDGKYYLV